jgi:WD40 repeat protein
MNTQGEIALSIRDGQGSSEIWLYDGANEGTAPEMIYERSGGLFDLDFHPDGDWLAIGGMEYASLVNITNGEQSRYPIQVESVYAVDFNDDGTQLAIGGGSSGLGVPFLMAVRWDDGQPIPPDADYYEPVTFIGHAHAIFDVQFAPSGNLLSASRDGTVRLWNAETGDMMMMAGF